MVRILRARINVMDAWIMFRVGIGFYIRILLWPLLQSLQSIQVLQAFQ